MKNNARKKRKQTKRAEIKAQQPFCGPNSKGVPPISAETLRWLHTYGLRLIGNRDTHQYAIFDGTGRLVYGQGYTLTPDQIDEYVNQLKIQKPILLPDGAAGVAFPDLWQKCEAIFDKGLDNYPMIQRLISAYPDEYAFALIDWEELQMLPKTYIKSHPELDEIIRRILNQIRDEKKTAGRLTSGLLI